MQNWEEVQLAVAALRQRLGAALPSRPDAAIILGANGQTSQHNQRD